jgi:hypothetical protein
MLKLLLPSEVLPNYCDGIALTRRKSGNIVLLPRMIVALTVGYVKHGG